MKKRIKKILDDSFWLDSLEPGEIYYRVQDDCDGDKGQRLAVQVGKDGDLHVTIMGKAKSLRFRTYFGRGMSLRTRNALLILAEAMRLDSEERPQLEQ